MRKLGLIAGCCVCSALAAGAPSLEQDFVTPPDTARPGVYWYFMDGHLTREGITADLEAMRKAGIGVAIFSEVGLGIPRGPVEFMSDPWRQLLKHAMSEADRLGLQMALESGPGWCGTGGPWVKPDQAMQHLVAAETTASGPVKFDAVLPRPQPRKPFSGNDTPALLRQWQEFYRDVAVLAFPTPAGSYRIRDIDEKALYHRASYSSQQPVKSFLPAPANFPALPPDQCIAANRILDLTGKLGPDGRLTWDVPAGNWTIMRFGRTITGQTTRPAPAPGLGLECDKFDPAALDTHFDAYIGTLLKATGEPPNPGRGLTTLHFDSWEMSSQNWSGRFREEFTKRRGYDPLRRLPVMSGRVVESVGQSERFLWDLRQTAQELVVENHALRLKELGRRHGLNLSLQPYDLNPCSDLRLGSAADVPMCEFWSKGYGCATEFSCIEAVSIAHTNGCPVVGAEAFTAFREEEWRQYPGSMKAQGDWALCCGINRFYFHRYQAQPRLDQWPGMTMGPYGIHWERTQTWWDLVPAYHLYLARCQQLLRRGLPVADILYLNPEGAPLVFRPPGSATRGDPPDRLGYNFDGCDPGTLIERAAVKDGRMMFPDGMSYRVLVMPNFDTMTPGLLRKIKQLVEAGAVVIGTPPSQSPSLEDYPQCDEQVKQLAAQLWGQGAPAAERAVGKGRLIDPARYEVQAASASTPLAQAKWIWHNEGNPASGAPTGTRYFSRTVELEPAKAVDAALFTMTADNRFELFVNGHSVGAGDDFNVPVTLDVSARLKPGANLFTASAGNEGKAPNPAGLLGALTIRFHDQSTKVVYTDRQWKSSLTPDGGWGAALELGPAGMGPWNLGRPPQAETGLYPGYAMTAQVLAKMDVPPDFEADGGLRYVHRRDGDADLYFIANRGDHPLASLCRFRVTGRQPEWWNPVTGERRDLPEYVQKDNLTVLPVRLEAYESGFVVFRKPAVQAARTGRNFPELTTVLTLTTPWEIAFDPKWGGPDKITFTQLEDWSKREEPGIKYYSGKAIYRTTFDCAAMAAGRPGAQVFLSLGDVKNLASVRLNGQDLGTVWCPPWRVGIPAGLLHQQKNALEITVANLWINRLIGDVAQPGQRLAQTTWNPFQANSPLQPSGLLGPVTLHAPE